MYNNPRFIEVSLQSPHNKFASIIIFGDTCDNHLYSMGVLSLGIRIVGVLKVDLCGYVVDMRNKIELY